MKLIIIFPLMQEAIDILGLSQKYTYPNIYSLRNFYPDREAGKLVIDWIFTSNGFNGSHVKGISPNTRLFVAMETAWENMLLPRENNWSYLKKLSLVLTCPINYCHVGYFSRRMRLTSALQVTEVNGEDLMANRMLLKVKSRIPDAHPLKVMWCVIWGEEKEL